MLNIQYISMLENPSTRNFLIGVSSLNYDEGVIHVGVEIPMGAHRGGGAKADRIYTLTLLALRNLPNCIIKTFMSLSAISLI